MQKHTTLPMMGLLLAAGLAGCASQPVPHSQLAVGRSSIESAQSAGAGELAPVELNQARNKMSQALEAVRNNQYPEARRLAEEADVDAQVARSKANAERSRRAAQEISAGLQNLRQQLTTSPTTPQQTLTNNPPAAGIPGQSRDLPGVAPSPAASEPPRN